MSNSERARKRIILNTWITLIGYQAVALFICLSVFLDLTRSGFINIALLNTYAILSVIGFIQWIKSTQEITRDFSKRMLTMQLINFVTPYTLAIVFYPELRFGILISILVPAAFIFSTAEIKFSVRVGGVLLGIYLISIIRSLVNQEVDDKFLYELLYLIVFVPAYCFCAFMAFRLKQQRDKSIKAKKHLLNTQTELARTLKQLEYLATVDDLTQLLNRKAFKARLEQEYLRAHRYQTDLTLIMVDIDKFKSVNDTYGHDRGDEALKMLANLLLGATRNTDIVGRWGGEEFMILLTEAEPARVKEIIRRFQNLLLQSPVLCEESVIYITVSGGVVDITPTESVEFFLKQVDSRLYQAKRGGRNQFIGEHGVI